MNLLTRYLLRGNLFLLFSILLIGTGLYVLTDLFERLDHFIDASFGLFNILFFYAVKVPFIVGQILPAVFLIAIIVQFCLMAKARELVALESGGVSPLVFLRFVIFYACIWAVAQFVLVQVLGIEGDKLATKIWREDIKGDDATDAKIEALWFTEGAYVVYLGETNLKQGKGKDFLAYKLSKDDTRLLQMVRAQSFVVEDKTWTLYDATVITPETYGYVHEPEMTLPLEQDISAFLAFEPGTKPSRLPAWHLRDAIQGLERSGSNVEVLRTSYYSHFAYAASVIVMGVLGLAITLWRNNVYLAVGIGLVCTFFYYAATTMCVSLGEKGVWAPLVAAWLPTGVFFSLGVAAIFCRIRPRLQ